MNKAGQKILPSTDAYWTVWHTWETSAGSDQWAGSWSDLGPNLLDSTTVVPHRVLAASTALVGGAAVVRRPDGCLDVLVEASDGLRHIAQTSPSGSWNGSGGLAYDVTEHWSSWASIPGAQASRTPFVASDHFFFADGRPFAFESGAWQPQPALTFMTGATGTVCGARVYAHGPTGYFLLSLTPDRTHLDGMSFSGALEPDVVSIDAGVCCNDFLQLHPTPVTLVGAFFEGTTIRVFFKAGTEIRTTVVKPAFGNCPLVRSLDPAHPYAADSTAIGDASGDVQVVNRGWSFGGFRYTLLANRKPSATKPVEFDCIEQSPADETWTPTPLAGSAPTAFTAVADFTSKLHVFAVRPGTVETCCET